MYHFMSVQNLNLSSKFGILHTGNEIHSCLLFRVCQGPSDLHLNAALITCAQYAIAILQPKAKLEDSFGHQIYYFYLQCELDARQKMQSSDTCQGEIQRTYFRHREKGTFRDARQC